MVAAGPGPGSEEYVQFANLHGQKGRIAQNCYAGDVRITQKSPVHAKPNDESQPDRTLRTGKVSFRSCGPPVVCPAREGGVHAALTCRM